MDRNYKTPVSSSSRLLSSTASSRLLSSTASRSAAVKRDSLAAGLERDPELSTAKRKQKTQAFTSHMNYASLERQLASAQLAKADLEAKLRDKDAVIERLETDRRYLAERETNEREEKEKEREEAREKQRKSDSDLRALRNTHLALAQEHAELVEAHSNLARSTAQTIASQKNEITTLTQQLGLLQVELREARELAEERNRTVEELQNQVDDISELQDTSRASLVDDESWSVVRDELHRQTDYLRAVEAANVKLTSEIAILKQKNDNVEVLKEQKRDLERKARDAEELRDRVVRLEDELATVKQGQQPISSSSEPQTPVAITQNLAALRVSYATLLDEHGTTAALLRQRELELDEAHRDSSEAQTAVARLREERDSLRDKAERHAHRAELAEREAKFLRAMVESFTAEEATQEGVKVEELTSQRVENLESLVTEYKATITEMEKKIEDLGGDPSTIEGGRPRKELLDELTAAKSERDEAQQALEEAQTEIEQQLEKIEELEQKLFDLQGEIGGGRHIPPGVRVLSLRENPAQQWADLSQAAMDRLKSENEALLKRLKELEESGVSAGHGSDHAELVPRESLEVVSREKEDLEGELKQKEKRLLRLKQVFTAKTDEFKQAIASILGVKLAFYPNGQVRVTSTFDLNAAFVFQPAAGEEGMKMQLVAQGEGGPEELPQLMRYWVEQEQCIPGFLASVTLQLYEKRKMEEELEEGQEPTD